MRERGSSGAMQGPSVASLRRLSGATLRRALLRLRPDHSHDAPQSRPEPGGKCARRVTHSLSANHAVSPPCQSYWSYLSKITHPSFSTLTLSRPLLTMRSHAG